MRLVIAIAAMMALVQPAAAMLLFLEADLGVEGNMHYCKYSDGNVYTVNAVELCPVSIDGGNSFTGAGNPFNRGDRKRNTSGSSGGDDLFSFGGGTSGGTTGFKKGEYQDGMTKVCIYDVLGTERAIRVNSIELCPLAPRF